MSKKKRKPFSTIIRAAAVKEIRANGLRATARATGVATTTLLRFSEGGDTLVSSIDPIVEYLETRWDDQPKEGSHE